MTNFHCETCGSLIIHRADGNRIAGCDHYPEAVPWNNLTRRERCIINSVRDYEHEIQSQMEYTD